MSKKRVRELASVDVSLVEVYEDLAHEDAEVRLKAAQKLLTQHLPIADEAQLKLILKRLFRGLCSGRKAARLGFSIALNETLSQIKARPDIITPAEIIDILDLTTVPDGNTTGQDERDHHFGRIFGSHAVITSGLLFNASAQPEWERLLDLLCVLSTKKPWLREECGWILWSSVQELVKDVSLLPFLQQIADKLLHYKLMRTPEGLAIWLSARRAGFANLLPKKIWKHEDPLAADATDALAQILRDARSNSNEDEEFGIQGSAMWSAKLHFAWDVVTTELLERKDRIGQAGFAKFWKGAVDDGLFASQGSKERKHWGFLLLRKMVTTAPTSVLPICFSNNVINSLMQSLKASDRYLQKDAQMILKALRTRSEDDPGAASTLISSLLTATHLTDFDAATKTKTMEGIWSSAEPDTALEIVGALALLIRRPGIDDDLEATKRRRNIITIQARLLAQTVNNAINRKGISGFDQMRVVILFWIDLYRDADHSIPVSPAVSSSTKSLLLQKLALAFEQVLKIGTDGRLLLLDCISALRDWELAADAEIVKIIESGWKRFRNHYDRALLHSSPPENNGTVKPLKGKDGGKPRQLQNEQEQSRSAAFALLYGLIIFQFHNDESDAISVLEELSEFDADFMTGNKAMGNADGLVEIILSFASKPSKFLRRITLDIFGALTSQITREGLSSLSNILQAKESKAGQEELFDADLPELEDGNASDSDLDSDVEMMNLKDVTAHSVPSDQDSGSISTDDSPSDTDRESVTDESLVDSTNADLIALELSLAEALGTRKLTAEDIGHTMSKSASESETDSDMDDDQMLSLDAKLSEVFRTRATTQSQSKEKQKANKAAKETMTNFKNRVLDMIDLYFKTEAQNSNSLDLILPLLRLMRTTTAKQLATKAGNLIGSLCNKCKGLQHAPTLETSSLASRQEGKPKGAVHEVPGQVMLFNNLEWALSILQEVHREVCLPASHAHKAACSQSSILLVKALLKAGVKIEMIIEVYSSTQMKMLVDETAAVSEAFFRDWIGWCGTVRGKLNMDSKRVRSFKNADSMRDMVADSNNHADTVDSTAHNQKNKNRKKNKSKKKQKKKL